MALYWHNAKTQPILLRILQCLRPPMKTKLYIVLTQTWQKVILALLQRARNVQTVIDALVYNHAKKGHKMHRTRPNITPTPAPCGRNLVQTLMQKGKHIRYPPLRHHHRAHAVNTFGAYFTRLRAITAASLRGPPYIVRSIRYSITQQHILNTLKDR